MSLVEIADETLIEVIANIPFNVDDLVSCSQVNHRLRRIIKTHVSWIMFRVLQIQFPLCEATTLRRPTVPCVRQIAEDQHSVKPVVAFLRATPHVHSNSQPVRALPVSDERCDQVFAGDQFAKNWPNIHHDTGSTFIRLVQSAGNRFPKSRRTIDLHLYTESSNKRTRAYVIHTKNSPDCPSRNFFDQCDIVTPFSPAQWWELILSAVADDDSEEQKVISRWLDSSCPEEAIPGHADSWVFALECYANHQTRMAVGPVRNGYCREVFISDNFTEKYGLHTYRLPNVVRLESRRALSYKAEKGTRLNISFGPNNYCEEMGACVVPEEALKPFDLIVPLGFLRELISHFPAKIRPPVLVPESFGPLIDCEKLRPVSRRAETVIADEYTLKKEDGWAGILAWPDEGFG